MKKSRDRFVEKRETDLMLLQSQKLIENKEWREYQRILRSAPKPEQIVEHSLEEFHSQRREQGFKTRKYDAPFCQLLGSQQHQNSSPFLHESIAGFLHDDWYCVFLQLEQSLIRPHLQLGNDVTNEERVHELFLTCNHAAVLATT